MQTPRTTPTREELKSQMAIGTLKKPKDKGMDGKGKVKDMQGSGGMKFSEEDTSYLRIQYSTPT